MKFKTMIYVSALTALSAVPYAQANQWDECQWPGRIYHCSANCTSAPQCTPLTCK